MHCEHWASAVIVYGAYGYTGQLVVERALARGMRPVLAGRNAVPLAEMAQRLGLEHRVADIFEIEGVLEGASTVIHCAGPFSTTSRPMVDACLRTGTNYIDITGEIDVFEAILARTGEAAAAGVVLLPGAGFDVVPSDCLAAMLARSMVDPVRLDLAVRMDGGFSAGTVTTAVEALGQRARCRIGGTIVAVPPERRSRTAAFADGTARVSAVSWGDVSTAYHSTAIPDITVYTTIPSALTTVSEHLGGILGRPMVRSSLQAVARRLPGPSASARRRSVSQIWGEVTGADGSRASGTVTTPNGYAFTADAVVEIARRIGTVPPGAYTPSRALGPDFVGSLAGVTVSV